MKVFFLLGDCWAFFVCARQQCIKRDDYCEMVNGVAFENDELTGHSIPISKGEEGSNGACMCMRASGWVPQGIPFLRKRKTTWQTNLSLLSFLFHVKMGMLTMAYDVGYERNSKEEKECEEMCRNRKNKQINKVCALKEGVRAS